MPGRRSRPHSVRPSFRTDGLRRTAFRVAVGDQPLDHGQQCGVGAGFHDPGSRGHAVGGTHADDRHRGARQVDVLADAFRQADTATIGKLVIAEHQVDGAAAIVVRKQVRLGIGRARGDVQTTVADSGLEEGGSATIRCRPGDPRRRAARSWSCAVRPPLQCGRVRTVRDRRSATVCDRWWKAETWATPEVSQRLSGGLPAGFRVPTWIVHALRLTRPITTGKQCWQTKASVAPNSKYY